MQLLLPLLLLVPLVAARLPNEREILPMTPSAVADFQRRHALTHSQHRRNMNTTDPCALLMDSSLFTPSEVRACMESIAFRPEAKRNIMAVATTMYGQLDVLAYNQLGNAQASLNQSIDIQAQFKRINSTNYTSDFAFQSDLSDTIHSLHDGHYAWTTCYGGAFSTSHGIPIISLASTAESNSTNIHIVPDVVRFVATFGLSELYASRQIDVASLAGAQVLTVEGKPVAQYLEEDKLPVTGTYVDKQQRLNSIFASYSLSEGAWQRPRGQFVTTRDWSKDNITMSVKTTNGTTKSVVIPWLVDLAGDSKWNHTSGESFWQAQCSAPKPVVDEDMPNLADVPETNQTITLSSEADLAALAQEAYAGCPNVRVNQTSIAGLGSVDPTNSSAYLGGRDVMFFKLPNRNTGVMFLSTFHPEPTTTPCLNRFMVDLVLGLRNLSTAGVQNILIDTSNNGGGLTVLSQLAQWLITGQRYENLANFESVLRRSPLSEAILQHIIDNPDVGANSPTFSPTDYRNSTSSSQLMPITNNYFSPGRNYSLNGQTLRTSNPLRDSTAQIQELQPVVNITNTPSFSPQNIVITGNGLCGSSCGSFTAFLIEYYNGTGYIQSAQPSKPIEFESFSVGQALTSDALYRDMAAIGFNNSDLLPSLDYAGMFGFSIRASISPNIAPGTFLQYRSFPAQYRFALTNETYSDQLAYWAYVANKAFPKNSTSSVIANTTVSANTTVAAATVRSAGREVVGVKGWKSLGAAAGTALLSLGLF